jgi:hypothetical protein
MVRERVRRCRSYADAAGETENAAVEVEGGYDG